VRGGTATDRHLLWTEFSGRGAEEFTSGDWHDAIHPEDRPRILEQWQAAVARGEPYEYEFRARSRDGSYRWLLARGQPVREAGGSISHWVNCAVDMHARMQAAESLQVADRRKDEFIATLAHELRNPLAPIQTAVELIRLRLSGGIEGAPLDVIDRQVKKMTRLIDDLLDLSRISHGKLELKTHRAELGAVIRESVDAVQVQVERASQLLVLELPAAPVFIEGDPTRLAQAFGNLLDNACKYTEHGGRISIVVEPQGTYVLIRVRDTGIGIEPEMLPRVFDMFSQADRSLERSRGGLGIGLTLVKRIIELHGGSVQARSGGVGTGSEFVVTLPAVEELIRDDSTIARPDFLRATSLLAQRVLIVDDNRDAADLLGLMLEALRTDFRVAYDGLEALRMAGEFRPDVILLDIGLPGMNGYDVARAIRAEPWGKGMTLVAITGWGQEEDRRRSREAGFDEHLVKPVPPVAIAQLLASLPA
jgi:PAS domain S-box-containing protein